MKHNTESETLNVSVGEDILSTNVETLSNDMKAVIEGESGNFKKVILDLDGVETIDSQGLNLLIGLFQECKKNEWEFQVVKCTDNVKWLFSIFKLTEVFGVNKEA